MHPVTAEGVAAEHITAMTQVADKARLIRQARHSRRPQREGRAHAAGLYWRQHRLLPPWAPHAARPGSR